MKRIIYTISFVLTLLLVSCEWFTAREPEKPDSGTSNFEPPTDYSIVISNFKNAISEKNLENYLACLADESKDKFGFSFNPSARAQAQYPSLFLDWGVTDENQSFNSLINSMEKPVNPRLNLYYEADGFENKQPDSAVFAADYILKIDHNVESIPADRFGGSLHLTIRRNKSGLWSIYRWLDQQSSVNDSIENTWSEMKALFY